MPIISRFYGITIRVNPREHLPPHFHVQYADDNASVEIATGEVMVGKMSPRTWRFVREWLELHRNEVQENWDCAQSGRACFDIEPL